VIEPLSGPNGELYANLGAALRAAHWGDFGDVQEVTLRREGHTDYVITKSPRGWYVSKMGDKVR
jgi:hypothetical protein